MNIWLVNDKGVKSEVVQFIPPKGAKDMAVFFFPRRDAEGHDFLTSDNKSFKVEFNGAFRTGSNPYAKLLPQAFEFDVKSIMYQNLILF